MIRNIINLGQTQREINRFSSKLMTFQLHDASTHLIKNYEN